MRARLLLLIGLLGAPLPLPAAAAPQLPPAARAVDVDEHLGATLPGDLTFTTAQGESMRLEEVLGRGLPVLLVLAYARCEMLCSWVLQGVSNSLPKLQGLTAGRDYLPVVVSIDPRETLKEAERKQAALLGRIGWTGEPARLPYLTGARDQIAALADALGFRYAWDARSEQYAHPSVIFVLTPSRKVARYVYGIQFPAPELSEALRRAAEDVIGELPEARDSAASALLRCFQFDAGAHRYAKQIQLYFRLGGLVLLLALLGFVGSLILWERRRRA